MFGKLTLKELINLLQHIGRDNDTDHVKTCSCAKVYFSCSKKGDNRIYGPHTHLESRFLTLHLCVQRIFSEMFALTGYFTYTSASLAPLLFTKHSAA